MIPAEKRRLTDDEYQFIFSRVPRLCVEILLVQDGGLLLVQRDIEPFKGFWTLPGGMVRYKETIDEALARIIFDELGVTCTEKKLLGYIDCHDDGPWLQSISLAFLVKFDGQLRGSDQGHNFKFFLDLPEKTQPYHAEFLKENWSTIVD